MKINHETLIDEKEFGDNTFRNQTPSPKEKEPSKPTKAKLKLPKRKVSSGSERVFYILHALTLLVAFVAGAFLGHASLFVFAIPYAIVLFISYRLGGEMKVKGLNHIIWNLSVLISTYTNANMRALRQRYKGLGIMGIVFMTIGGMTSGLLLVVGLIAFVGHLLFAFAEMNTEIISNRSKLLSITLLVAGVIAFFMNPLLAYGTLSLSLMANWFHEKWGNYEFIRD